ncbi:hypothetical protein PAXRUDRAFT_153602 [Paxillus rubicundulus Ve08.2h10]|uniref:Yeast cell wall synthesis Kre9/Knh1-like N-terminal domain-containing protein n=1 Tax=Paxillus rubicundulus Ve08.2h10 TaxID=930991 RepID=A0A0D0DE07_9AGAM|nr:hypothetical protein PAXRUDRAFT_153602 [Paxillus rubicundulus Ve08.2h10]
MFGSVLVSLALAASALANLYVTSPIATTTFTAGQQATISWQDNGQSPTLLQFGNATFAIYVGNAIQQTPLQTIVTNVNVSTTSSIVFTPDGTIGPNSSEYFVRVTSLTLMDPTQPQFPAEAFSAKFTMTGMTGTFNSSIQAQIDGQSTAPIGPTASSGPSASNPAVKATSLSASTTKATASATPSSNAAGKPVVTGLVGFVAALIGASLL